MLPPPRFMLRSRWSERWVSSIWRSIARKFLPRYSVQCRFGRMMLCDREEAVGRAMICKGLWEFRQIEMMEREIAARRKGQRAIFLDVGAFWGLYAMYFETKGIFDEIHCVEASPRNQTLLDLNLQMNDLEDAIHVHPIAVSDGPGILDAVEFGAAARLRKGAAAIETAALDDVIGPRDCFLVIKMDVDGHEARALDGMAKMIAGNDVLMLIETLPDMKDEVFEKLHAMGLTQIGFVPRDDYLFVSGRSA